MTNKELEHVARKFRKDILVATHAKSGHPALAFHAVVLTYLYFEEMNVDPSEPRKVGAEYFCAFKGHVTPALYGVLAERVSQGRLETFRLNTRLQGHPKH